MSTKMFEQAKSYMLISVNEIIKEDLYKGTVDSLPLKLRTTFCPKLAANEPLEQSTVLSEYKRQSDRPPVRAIPSSSMDNIISYEEAAALVANPSSLTSHPNFKNSLTAPHPTRLTVPQLPPEQHIGVGGTYHDKIHV